MLSILSKLIQIKPLLDEYFFQSLCLIRKLKRWVTCPKLQKGGAGKTESESGSSDSTVHNTEMIYLQVQPHAEIKPVFLAPIGGDSVRKKDNTL